MLIEGQTAIYSKELHEGEVAICQQAVKSLMAWTNISKKNHITARFYTRLRPLSMCMRHIIKTNRKKKPVY